MERFRRLLERLTGDRPNEEFSVAEIEHAQEEHPRTESEQSLAVEPHVRRRRSEKHAHEEQEAPLILQADVRFDDQPAEPRVPVHGRKRRRRASRWKQFFGHLGQISKALADFGIVIVVSILFAGKWLWDKARALFHRSTAWIKQRTNPEESASQQRKKSAQRFFYYTPTNADSQDAPDAPEVQEMPKGSGMPGQVRIACIAVLLCVSALSIYKLGSYAMEYMSAKRVSDALREEYYAALAAETPVPTPLPVTPTPIPTSTATPVLRVTPIPQATAAPTPTPRTMLPKVEYPQNPYRTIRSRFQKLQRQNEDIVGWLTIPDLIDEAVVQRDNSYYLRRDYRGYHNDNGAIFMEESCNLMTRPYTILLYGHNMKSGAMFGCLRNYEKVYFYRHNPFITFDTAYEDGRYVIFAVGTLSQRQKDLNYVSVGGLISSNIARRETSISQLRRISTYATSIEVEADDQLLLLITCVDDDTERRFVAARRVRDGETEAQLQKQVDKTRSR